MRNETDEGDLYINNEVMGRGREERKEKHRGSI